MDKEQDEEGDPTLLLLCGGIFDTDYSREFRYTRGWYYRLGCGWYYGRWYSGGNGIKKW